MDEGMANGVTDAHDSAHEAGHGAPAELPLYPAPVEAIRKRLDSPAKRMGLGVAAFVFVVAFFAFAYAMGLGAMKNSSGVSRDAAIAAEKIATAQPEAPAASYTPPQTTGASELAAASTATPPAQTPAEPTISVTATSPDAPGTTSSSSDAVLTGASTDAQLPGTWKTVWSGAGKSTTAASWQGPTFSLKSGFVRCGVDFSAGGSVTVYLVQVKPVIGKWALLEGAATPGTPMTSDPRSIEAGTYRLQVDGDGTFKASVQQ